MSYFHRLALLPLVLCLSACGSDGSGPGDAPPGTAAVAVGNDFFQSTANSSTDPAVDTVSVNGTVTWTWLEVGDHGVAFDGTDIPPSDILFDTGSQHSVTFATAGTYLYTCAVHRTRMSGTVVVR